MEYKPGDIINSHLLDTDNVWHPVAAVLPQPSPLGYWGRYSKRWRKTYLVFAVLAALNWMSSGAASHEGFLLILLNLLLAATLVAAFMAAFVNLLVAIPSLANSQRLPVASVPAGPDDPSVGTGGSLPVIHKPDRSKRALAAGLVIAAIAAAVVWAASVSGGGSSTPTPEKAFIETIRTAEPNSASTPDDTLLASGRTVCTVYGQQGADGVTRALDGIERANGAEVRRIMGVISIAARKYLCP